MMDNTDIGDENPSSGKSWPSVKPILLLAVVGLILVAVVRFRNVGHGEAGKSPAVGKKFTRLSLQSVSDNTTVQESDLAGQVVLISFWGPWCPPCLEELPHLVELFEHFRTKKDFRFISVTCAASGQDEDQAFLEQSRAFLTKRNAQFSLYSDPRIVTRQALLELDASGGFGYPTTVILDRQGTIRGCFVGFQRGDEVGMSKLLDELLNTK